ncbi:MAG: hypothetical protein AB2693_28440 [Candidatus Thiodiazotropha sp.]
MILRPVENLHREENQEDRLQEAIFTEGSPGKKQEIADSLSGSK